MNIGKVVQVVGPVVDVEFPGALPPIYNALTVDYTVESEPVTLTLEVQQHLGDSWVRTISMSGTEGLKRGIDVVDTGGPIYDAGRRRRDGTHLRRHRQAGRRARPGDGREALSDPSPAATARRSVDVAAGADHRHQGHRSDLSVPEGRQGRRLRRRRRRQDRRHHGADQQHRQAPRRRLGVRRRRRAHPRGQRPLPRDVGGRRHQPEGSGRVEDRARLRADERAARARACAWR